MIKKLVKHSFKLSILTHLLLALFFISIIIQQPAKKPHLPDLYTPSYVYTGAITPTSAQTPSKANPTPTQQTQNSQEQTKKIMPDKNGILHKSVLDMAKETFRAERFQAFERRHEEDEDDPILLIGDKNKIAD